MQALCHMRQARGQRWHAMMCDDVQGINVPQRIAKAWPTCHHGHRMAIGKALPQA